MDRERYIRYGNRIASSIKFFGFEGLILKFFLLRNNSSRVEPSSVKQPY